MASEVLISRVNAACLAALDEVRCTGVPVRVEPAGGWLGWMAGSVEVAGDIRGPIGAFADRDGQAG